MKKSGWLLVLVAVLFFATGLTAAFSGGDGSFTSPYQIINWTDLNEIRNDLTANYTLMNNLSSATLDYSGLGNDWVPIADYSGNGFEGNLEGNNKTISDLMINLPSTDYAGLFGYVIGNISNLGLIDVNITGSSYVGGLVGELDIGTVFNCYSTGNVTGSGKDIGGLVGDLYGSISDSYSTVNVIGGGVTVYNLGGLVGAVEYWGGYGLATISNSYSIGDVSGINVVGGFVGFMDGGNISNSYATGNVSGKSYIGGFAGQTNYDSGSIISGAYSTGNVFGTSASVSDGKLGGFIGLLEVGCNISNSYATGNVSSSRNFIGGFAGSSGGTINNSYSIGNVSGGAGNTSAFVDDFFDGVVSNSYWNNETSGILTSSAGTEKTTAEMQTESTFTDAGWNFTSIWVMGVGSYEYPILQWQDIADTVYPQFSNYSDNNATLSGSGTAVFNVTVENTNGTVWLSINNTNYTATNLSFKVYNVSVSLINGSYNYTWISWGNGTTNNYNTSSIFVYVVNTTPETVQEETSSSSYFSKIYFTDKKFSTEGNEFNLWYTDKIKFIARYVNHTLTMQRFNSTTARVLIESNPVTFYLQKGVLYEFDLNNDSINDIKARYDGMNKTKAMIFIQEIVPVNIELIKEKTAVSSEVKTEEKIADLEYSDWKVYFIVIALVLLILFLVWKKFAKKIEEYFWIKGIERSRRKNKHHQYYP